MTHANHDTEGEGAKSRDHAHLRHPYWKRAHKDWRLWIVVLLMVGLIFIYVMTDNFAIRPGKAPGHPVPAAN